jgi:hypothetical protein
MEQHLLQPLVGHLNKGLIIFHISQRAWIEPRKRFSLENSRRRYGVAEENMLGQANMSAATREVPSEIHRESAERQATVNQSINHSGGQVHGMRRHLSSALLPIAEKEHAFTLVFDQSFA